MGKYIYAIRFDGTKEELDTFLDTIVYPPHTKYVAVDISDIKTDELKKKIALKTLSTLFDVA